MTQTLFSSFLTSTHFSIETPTIDTSNYLMASSETMKEVGEKNEATTEALMEKHNTDNPREAMDLEIKEREKKWQPSEEALAYIKGLNDAYRGKSIKFYYTDPMLSYFSIDDPDCNHIPVYEVLCESIELVDTETRKLHDYN